MKSVVFCTIVFALAVATLHISMPQAEEASGPASPYVSVEAAYTVLSPGFGVTRIFQEDVVVSQTVARELTGVVDDPDPPVIGPTQHFGGYHVFVKTIVPDRSYRIVGLGGRGGSTPEVQGFVQLHPPFRIVGLEDSLVVSGTTQVFENVSSGPQDYRLTFLDFRSQTLTFRSMSSCSCALPDGAGIFFSLVVTNHVDAVVDIKPGSDVNPINLGSRGVIPVAVFGSATLDASQIDVGSLAFGPAGAGEADSKVHLEDVDGDGVMDAVLHFRTQDAGIQPTDTSACLSGSLIGGATFSGCDSIRIVPG